MKNENFDADLKNHIKQIFEDFNDSQANEGWNLLREKYPEKNKRKYFFWWLSAAILLFTFLLIWFFPSKTDYVKSVKYTKAIQSNVANTPIKIDSPLKNLFIKTDSFNTILAKKSLVKTAFKFTLKQKPTQQKTSIVNLNNTEINQQKKLNNTVFTDIKLDSVNYKNSQTSALSLTKTDSVSQKNTQLIDSIKKSITKANTKKDVVETASISTPIQKVSKFGLSLYAGPHINFASNSNTLLGFGAGMSTDFALNKKLKLETGLGLIQNKLYYQNNSNNNLSVLNPAYLASSFTQNTSLNSTSLNSLSASLLQLDVPVNIVYQILPGKNSIAILAGLSSGVFAKERYQYNYLNFVNNSQVFKSFQSFYLLKTLNLAAQIGLPISKYNLQVEPFAKVPLGNISIQQLKFGATGINLKFNLQLNKN